MSSSASPRIVVISGSSRGIGLAIAEAFARTGAQTVLAASSATTLAAAAQRIAATGAPEPVHVAGDLRTIAGCDDVHRVVAERFGRCDVLVNSAGATRAGSFLAQPDEDWQDGFALKFYSCVRLCRLFWPMLKQAQFAPFPVEEQVVSIFAGTRGYLDTIAVTDVVRFEREMLSTIRAKHADILDAIRTDKELKKDTEAKLASAIEHFVKVFA